jgi:pyruvate, orthophosphate dikinase
MMATKAAAKRAGKSPAPSSQSPRGRKYAYFFGSGKADGNRNMKDLLGGKGSGLAEMTNAGLPVPPGFTISTEVCNIYYEQNRKIPAAIDKEIAEHVKKLEKAAGATLGSNENPLLVSVRSGAKFSMPGMMDTILNLGLNDQAVEGLKSRTQNGRFAFEHEFEAVKKARGAKSDTDLDEQALRDVV